MNEALMLCILLLCTVGGTVLYRTFGERAVECVAFAVGALTIPFVPLSEGVLPNWLLLLAPSLVSASVLLSTVFAQTDVKLCTIRARKF